MKIVSEPRWQFAQKAEMAYWERVREDALDFLRILHEKYVFLSKINLVCPKALTPPEQGGNVLEIGIGPLGIGVASLLEPIQAWRITGIDPLPRIREILLPAHLLACFSKLMERQDLEYIQTKMEDYEEPVDYYDTVFCYNVLDHTQDPFKVIKNAYNVLRPGGYFCLGVDTLSCMSKLRFLLFPHRYYDPFHPHRFGAKAIADILKTVPFQIIWFERSPMECIYRVCWKARRLTIVCQKPVNDSKNDPK